MSLLDDLKTVLGDVAPTAENLAAEFGRSGAGQIVLHLINAAVAHEQQLAGLLQPAAAPEVAPEEPHDAQVASESAFPQSE